MYRTLALPALVDAVREKYRDVAGFELREAVIRDRSALLVDGSMTTDKAGWAARLEGLTGLPVDRGNLTSAALLLIRDGTHAWALSYGMGFHLLESEYVDSWFGLRVTLRVARPDQLRSLTRTTIDQRARTDRSSIPSGEPPRGFGIGDFGEIVTRLVGPATIPGLSGGDKVTIEGADALSLPLGRTPGAALSDLEIIGEVLERPPLRELEALEQLAPVKKPDVQGMLELRLRTALEEHCRPDVDRGSTGPLGMAWPHERLGECAIVGGHRLIGLGRGKNGPFDHLPTLDGLATAAQERGGDLVQAVGAVKVQICSDADGADPVGRAISARKWLAFETTVGSRRYCLHDGDWYQMDQDYAERLRRHIEEILARQVEVRMPVWSADYPDENTYNVMAARALGGIALDRKLIYTVQHPRGIEPFDVVTTGGLPIHVKRLDRSTAASHVIAQALVSADALLHDENAREALHNRISEAGGDPDVLGKRPTQVALGLARAKPLSVANLFSFSAVTLARLDSALAAAGIELLVLPIKREVARVAPPKRV